MSKLFFLILLKEISSVMRDLNYDFNVFPGSSFFPVPLFHVICPLSIHCWFLV